MDDIKLYANNNRQLRKLLEKGSKFSNDRRMNFGLDKCNIVKMLKEKLTPPENITLSIEETIKALDMRDQDK